MIFQLRDLRGPTRGSLSGGDYKEPKMCKASGGGNEGVGSGLPCGSKGGGGYYNSSNPKRYCKYTVYSTTT